MSQKMKRNSLVAFPLILCIHFGCTQREFDYYASERNHLRFVGLGAEGYRMAHKEYPTKTEQFADYLDGDNLKDVWGNLIQFNSNGQRFDIISAGPDRKFSTVDDIVIPSEHVMDSTKFNVLTTRMN